MNDTAPQQGTATSLKLRPTPAGAGDAAVRPATQPPVPPPCPGSTTARTDPAEQKDGFVASAALGGIIAALAMVLLIPTFFFLVNLAKGALSDAPTATEEVQAVKAVSWPDVTLTGILAAEPKRGGSAILNGQLINLNQQLLGVRVVAFQDQEVVLEFERARKTLRVGENTL